MLSAHYKGLPTPLTSELNYVFIQEEIIYWNRDYVISH